jgi:hypothetical protein
MRLIFRTCLSLALLVVSASVETHVQAAQPCGVCPIQKCESVPLVARPPKPDGPNWIFQPGIYSHDPRTGERITQFASLPAVEPFPDTRGIASGYHRSRINQIGTGGSVDTYYRVENWSNIPGGLDAEWERVNDVWQQSTLTGGYGSGGYGSGGYGYGQPYGQGGYRGGYGPGNGGGYGPGYGGGGYGPGNGGGYAPGYGGPGNGGGYGPGYGGYPGGGYPGGNFPGGGYGGGYGQQAF